MSLSVPAYGVIEVKADPSLSDEKIAEFIYAHRRFIERRMAQKQRENTAFFRIKSYEKVLVFGQELPLKQDKNEVKDGIVFYRNRKDIPYTIEKFWKEDFMNLLSHYAKSMNVTFTSVSFGKGKSRWGSCSREGKLFFSRFLFMLPVPLVEYVVVHELAHRYEMNHSIRFWNIVSSVLPDWKERRNTLKEYEFLTKLYEETEGVCAL